MSLSDSEIDYARQIAMRSIDEAGRARVKFPQPNKVLLKVAEEAGEVVKAGVHMSEGRDFTFAELEAECIQTIAMCLRLLIEGDGTIGLKVPKRYEPTMIECPDCEGSGQCPFCQGEVDPTCPYECGDGTCTCCDGDGEVETDPEEQTDE